ncbi:Cytoplasmic tRNA 2-thiolation protein 2 [Coemansia interrupta]|uniref:Cytoplasmic tRNA 2-thiolation protein 2 n=1 Tax=Coemansia interrupta TaxID=1126814 RepID=A0A9W8LHC8_9FUNG|nr:Cytoplasmic tRNA 2-thiolation protein 2 [Coemansia interrupta]
MCDADTEHKPILDTRLERKRVPGKCIKCKTAKPNVTIRGCLYCKPCFVSASIVKFRGALKKSNGRIDAQRRQQHGVSDPQRLMVALSGGPSSTAMLNLVVDYQQSVTQRSGDFVQPPYADIVVGHIDESALFNVPEGAVRSIADGRTFCEASLEDIFSASTDRDVLLQIVRASMASEKQPQQQNGGGFSAQIIRDSDNHTPPRERLRQLFSALDSDTSRESLLDAIRTFLLVRLARAHHCAVLLLGDSATRIATRVVSLTSCGRGFSLPFEIASESSWFDGVTMIRPMRDFIAKEVAFFNRWAGYASVVVPTFTTSAPVHASIDRLSESFVVGLDRDFSSTVSTVCRTVQKLEPRAEALAACPCIVCGMPAEPDAQDWRSRLTVGQAAAPASSSAGFDISSHLCYSCQNILHFSESGDSGGLVLPGFCVERIRDHTVSRPSASSDAEQHEVLRRQVEQFFLNSDDDDDDN